MISMDIQILLVFINVKSGDCQDLELISSSLSFHKLLNPYQVFDLDNGRSLPGKIDHNVVNNTNYICILQQNTQCNFKQLEVPSLLQIICLLSALLL